MITLNPWVKSFVESPHRFNWFNCTRQGGKSTALIIRRAYRGMHRKRLQIIVSASIRQATYLAKKSRAILEGCGVIGPDDQISLSEIHSPKNHLHMVFCPPNPRTIRGFSGDVGLDEAAMLLPADDPEVWKATFPMVTVGQGEYDICSTPKGVKNQFAKLRDNKQFHHMTVTIDDAVAMGGSITAADRQALRETSDDEEMWQQEFECAFLDEATAYLTYEMIGRCVHDGLPYENEGSASVAEGSDLYVGVDLGRSKDLTCIWVAALHPDDEEGILKTCQIIVMKNVGIPEQYRVLAEILQDERVRKCCIDKSFEPGLCETAVEHFSEYRVEGIKFANPIKNEMGQRLRMRVQETTIQIPSDEKIRNDWHAVKKDVTHFSGVRLTADSTKDGHADRFWAAALCCQAAAISQGYCENPVIFARRN